MKKSYYFAYKKSSVATKELDKNITENNLPLPLQPVLEVVGLEIAISFLKEYQGKRVYIPKEPKPDHKLTEVMSYEHLQNLGRAIGGTRLDLRHSSIGSVYNSAYFKLLKDKYRSSDKPSFAEFCKQHNLKKTHYFQKKIAN